MKKSEVVKFLILRTLGNFFLLFSIAGFIFTFGDVIKQEAVYRVNTLRGVQFIVPETIVQTRDVPASQFGRPSQFAPLLAQERQMKTLTAKDIDFSILIPKIGATAKVVPNVNPGNEQEYLRALQVGVAHAAGTVFPGMNGNIYLFAHSADSIINIGRYNAIFYLLKELEAGDEIVVVFNGQRHNYTVFDKRIVGGSEVDYLRSKMGEGETLTLQTCWPPGTPWKRLLVFARPSVQR